MPPLLYTLQAQNWGRVRRYQRENFCPGVNDYISLQNLPLEFGVHECI